MKVVGKALGCSINDVLLSMAAGALRDYLRLARMRYDNGFTSYLEVTDAETKLFNADLQYTQAQGQLFFALINVYKSMGGGWVIDADRMTEAAGMESKLPK